MFRAHAMFMLPPYTHRHHWWHFQQMSSRNFMQTEGPFIREGSFSIPYQLSSPTPLSFPMYRTRKLSTISALDPCVIPSKHQQHRVGWKIIILSFGMALFGETCTSTLRQRMPPDRQVREYAGLAEMQRTRRTLWLYV